ncbi:hypothetical protein HZ326_30526, partial [Fusarium oxysporum f. sp. albedinis]
RMEPSKFAGCQGTPTSPATNRPTSWQRQRHRSQSPKALNRRWLTYEESQDRSPKKRSRRGGDHRLPAGALAPARSLAPSTSSEIPPWGLRCVSREIRPQRRTPGLLMWPTQSTGSHLLLQKSTAASSDEACTLSEYGSEPCNRKRLQQIHRPVQGQRVLWKDLPSLLGDDNLRSTRNSPSLSIFHTSLLLPFLPLVYAHGQMKGATAPLTWPGPP